MILMDKRLDRVRTLPRYYENTTTLLLPLKTLMVGVLTHNSRRDSEYSGGQNSVGRLVFDAFQDFTLNSVDVYTNEPGYVRLC